MSSSEAERLLRERAEDLIAVGNELPIAEAVAALVDLESAALALAGAGLVDHTVALAVVVAAVDALAVRGAAWVEPASLDLDVAALHRAVSAAPRTRLLRVVPVGATVGASTVTSLELWDDRAEARVVGHDGSVLSSHHLDAVGPDERFLSVSDGRDLVGVDPRGGVAAAPIEESAVEVDGAVYLDRLSWHAAAAAQTVDIAELNARRRQLTVVADVLGASSDVVRGFDDAVGGSTRSESAALREVVALARRWSGGWLASIESWSDHWRLVAIVDVGSVGAFWTALDPAGTTYGGVAIAVDVVRFEPALPVGWSTLSLGRVDGAGGLIEMEVTRT
jgi:hypothetical protein